MDFAFPINLSLRDALIALVALLLLYLIVAFLRIRRLKRHKAGVEAPSPVAVQSAVAAYAAVQEPELKTEPEPVRPDSRKLEPEPLAAPSDAAFPWNEPPGETALLRQVALLESEIAQLRKEVGGLRAEVLVLREELQREHAQVQAAPPISPLYSEPMQMAMHGASAGEISMHCGISRAEAELVTALARNRADG